MNQHEITQARGKLVKFAYTVGELLTEQSPDCPQPFRVRRRRPSTTVVNWRHGDHLVELVGAFYSAEPLILRISGNFGFYTPSHNLLKHLGFFPRCPVCWSRCRRVWNDEEEEMVCSRSGHRFRHRGWKPELATRRFEISCLPSEIASLAPLAMAVASGVPMADLLKIPGAKLLTPHDQRGSNMSYVWTSEASDLSEDYRQRREATKKRKEQAS